VLTDEVFRRFTEYAGPLMTNAAGAEALLAAMRKDANTFRNFAQLSDGTAEGNFYSRVVETMELAATSPLLLWMLSENHAVPGDQIAAGLKALESWVIRRTLLRYTMKDVNKMMVAILKALEEVPYERAGEAVRDYLEAQKADARIWPTDDDLKIHLPRVRLYGNIRQGRLRVALEAVEMRLRTDKHEAVALPPKLELEHVMPQGWRSHWDTTPKLLPEAAAERDRRINCLGNLTLITKKLNGSLSNRPWTDSEAQALGGGGPDAGKGKRSLLDKYSLLVLSKDITSQHQDAWTDQDIEKRSRFLAEQICKIWPGPPASRDFVQDPSWGSSSGDSAALGSEVKEPASPASSRVMPSSSPATEVPEEVLRKKLEVAMRQVYIRAKAQAGYDAKLFLGMLSTHGGLQTAKRLLASQRVSDGFVALWERKRIDLTVENVVLRPEFAQLFTDDEREIARERLREYGFDAQAQAQLP
jgi:hypothetical protein